MYQFLNCLPLGPAKLIRRFKLMKQRAHRRSLSKSNSSNLNRSDLNNLDSLSVKLIIKNGVLDLDEDKNVKLVSYSNLDTTIAEELIAQNESSNKLIEATRLNSTLLEKIIEEDGEQKEELINEIVIKEERIVRSEFEEEVVVNDQILHELHVNSQNSQINQPSTNCFATLDKHLDCCNVDEANSPPKNTSHNSTTNQINKLMDLAPSNKELNNEQVKLINNTQTIDELDSTVKQLTNEQTTNQSNETNQLNQVNNNNDQPIKQILTTTKPTTKELTKTHLLTTNQLNDNVPDDKRKTNKKLQQDTDLRTIAILNGTNTWIELNKGSDCALGIILIERTVNNEKLFIIHEILEKGIADTDQRLNIGDIILQVNELPLKEMTCDEANDRLNRTSGSVKLLIYRELICVNEQLNNSSTIKINYSTKSTMQELDGDEIEKKIINGKLYEIIRVELQKKSNNKGLGLCIVHDGKSPGAYISEILPNSVAYLDGNLKKGDHILNVNGEDVTNVSITTTLAMLKCLQGLISLKIARLMPGQIVSLESFNQSIEYVSFFF